MLKPVVDQIKEQVSAYHRIDSGRSALLLELAQYVAARITARQPARLTFICTHNSRRSHLSQIWAQTAAEYFQLPGIEAYSGGIEITAFNPRASRALSDMGFHIECDNVGKNPVSRVFYAKNRPPIVVFSKIHDQPPNPVESYAAVMTCSHADANCPHVLGPDLRLCIAYEDPKAFDGSELEASAYAQRSRQIAREMLYLFSRARTILDQTGSV